MTPEPVRRPRCTCHDRGKDCLVCRMDATLQGNWQALTTMTTHALAQHWRIDNRIIRRWKQECGIPAFPPGHPPTTRCQILHLLSVHEWHTLGWLAQRLPTIAHKNIGDRLTKMWRAGLLKRRGPRWRYEYALARPQDRAHAA